MSRHSYIAFPREIDDSCIKSLIDRSKLLRAKDLKGTEYESWYAGCPDESSVYTGEHSDSLELVIYPEKPPQTFSFSKVFENKYIYFFNGQFGVHGLSLETMLNKLNMSAEEMYFYVGLGWEEVHEGLERKEFLIWETVRKTLEEGLMWHCLRCTKQLYDLIRHNTDKGETVEIYAKHDYHIRWDSSGKKLINKNYGKYGTPKDIRTINMEEICALEMLELKEGLKTEIRVL